MRQMRPDALMINTARGGLVDEEALVVAHQRGVIGGAVSGVGRGAMATKDHLHDLGRGVASIVAFEILGSDVKRQRAVTHAPCEGRPRHRLARLLASIRAAQA